jgi:hypothetical protein
LLWAPEEASWDPEVCPGVPTWMAHCRCSVTVINTGKESLFCISSQSQPEQSPLSQKVAGDIS